MKIFIVTVSIPYPLNSGGNISQYATLEKLQKVADVTLCFPIRYEKDYIAYLELAKLLPQVNIEIIDQRKSIAESEFFNQIVSEVWNNLNIKLNFVQKVKQCIKEVFFEKKVKPFVAPSISEDFEDSYLIAPCVLKDYQFCLQLLEIIAKNEADIYQIEFYDFIDIVDLLPVNKPKVFIHHEVRYQRLARSADTSSKNAHYTHYVIEAMKAVELAQLNKFNAVVTFSDNDKNLITNYLPNKVHVIPFPVLDSEFNNKKNFTKVDKLIFIGAESHHPNHDAIIWFLENCFNEVYSKYKIPLYIIGNWSQNIQQQYAVENKVIFTGFVDDTTELNLNAVNISPIRVGSGIRTKILYAMANYTPVISTSIGVEGIMVENGKHLLVADEPKAFVDALATLIEQPVTAQKLAENAFEFVSKNYRQEQIVDLRLKLYTKLLTANIQEHE